MFVPVILVLVWTSIASAINNTGGQLLARQAVCDPSDQPVKSCGSTDLTTANWNSFNINNFYATFLSNFGIGDNIGFPGFFVQQHLPPGEVFLFDCTFVDAAECKHPAGVNPTLGTDCAFKDIPNIAQEACGKYISPQAGFVVENFIRFHRGVSNNYLAIGDAGNSILNTNFIDDVVNGLSEEQGNIIEAIFEAIAGFVLGILPFGRAFTLGVQLFKNLDRIYSLAGEDKALSGPFDALSTIVANEQIQDLAERTKDQLRRQVEEMVSSSQKRMVEAIDIVFGTGPKSVAGQVGGSAQEQFAFNLADSGAFLNEVPSREDLAAVMERNMKNWVVSSVMSGMGWNVLLDETPLFDDPEAPGRVCRDGFKGIPGILNSQCAMFRRGSFGDPQPQNPSIIENLINVEDMMRNAQECDGGAPNWDAVVDGTDDSATPLPRCLYTFPVEVVPNRTGKEK